METHFVKGKLLDLFEDAASPYKTAWDRLKAHIESDSDTGLGCGRRRTQTGPTTDTCKIRDFAWKVFAHGQQCKIHNPQNLEPRHYGNAYEAHAGGGNCFLGHFVHDGGLTDQRKIAAFLRRVADGKLTDAEISDRFYKDTHQGLKDFIKKHIQVYRSADAGTRKLAFMGPYQLHKPINNYEGEVTKRWFLRFVVNHNDGQFCPGLDLLYAGRNKLARQSNARALVRALAKYVSTFNLRQLEESTAKQRLRKAVIRVAFNLRKDKEMAKEVHTDSFLESSAGLLDTQTATTPEIVENIHNTYHDL